MENDRNHEVPGADESRKKEDFKPIILESNLIKRVDDSKLKEDIRNNV